MAKPKKGESLVCFPCGREVVVSSAGVSRATIWCCGVPMKPKRGAKRSSASRGKKTSGRKSSRRRKGASRRK